MKEEHEYLLPAPLKDFVCKMGACRHACCEGWPITFSVDDYFRLMGSEHSAELGERLDRGIKLNLSPTPDRYAIIYPKYDGNCPMRLPDGRCSIQAELGEGVLAAVCRLYPRGLHFDPVYECSFSNSCEGVLEMLFESDAPISFVKKPMAFDINARRKRSYVFDTMGREEDIRLWLISLVQERAYPLTVRILRLGKALLALDDIMERKDRAALDTLLDGDFITDVPDICVDKEHLADGLHIMERLLAILDGRSNSVCDYGEEALKYFTADDSFDAYLNARQSFETTFPRWEIWFEHMLVNHMFFEQFPFQDRPEKPWDEFVSVCAVYALLRFLSLGCFSARESYGAYVDMCAALFRLVGHTAFSAYAGRMLASVGCHTPDKVFELISL